MEKGREGFELSSPFIHYSIYKNKYDFIMKCQWLFLRATRPTLTIVTNVMRQFISSRREEPQELITVSMSLTQVQPP